MHWALRVGITMVAALLITVGVSVVAAALIELAQKELWGFFFVFLYLLAAVAFCVVGSLRGGK